MEDKRVRCNISSGAGWRCSHDALPGMRRCQKHELRHQQLKKMKGQGGCEKRKKRVGKVVSRNEYGGKKGGRKRVRSKSQMPTTVSNGTLVQLEEEESLELGGENLVNEKANKDGELGIDTPLASYISQKLDGDESMDLVGENHETPNIDGEPDIDPLIASYISQKVENLRKAVEASIQAKASSLQEKLLSKYQRCQDTHLDNTSKGNMKIGTRFELPFFQRYLDQQKYGYTLGLIELYISQPNKDLNSTISKVGKFSLTRKDMSTLGPAGWLSRGVIGSYAHLINQTSKRLTTNGTPTVIVSNLLYNRLATANKEHETACKVNYKVVRLDDLTVFNPTQTKILIPVNLCDLHWGLVMVDMSTLSITVLDPKLSSNETTTEYKSAVEVIKIHLSKACVSSDGERKRKKWSVENCDEVLPQQSNDYDCGLFILAYMECIMRGIPFNFNLDDSKSRIVICSDLLDYILLGD